MSLSINLILMSYPVPSWCTQHSKPICLYSTYSACSLHGHFWTFARLFAKIATPMAHSINLILMPCLVSYPLSTFKADSLYPSRLLHTLTLENAYPSFGYMPWHKQKMLPKKVHLSELKRDWLFWTQKKTSSLMTSLVKLHTFISQHRLQIIQTGHKHPRR